MNINRILEGLSNTLEAGNQEQTQAETLTPTFVPQSETTSAEKLFDRQNYGDYLRNQIEARWTLETESQQDNFEQKAKELIDKYTPKDVVLIGKFDSKGLGAELAAFVPKGAKLGTAVFAQLSAGDKADTARAVIDNLNDETLKRMAKTRNGKALLEQTVGLLDGQTTNMWDIGAFAKGDTERKTRIETAFGKPQVEQKQPTTETKQPAQTVKTGDVNQMFEGVKGAAELNKKLLEVINAVDPQPAGKKPGGIRRSESDAAYAESLERITKHDLKAKFERLGDKYGVPPALIAGIASRESEMGRTTKQSGKYAGWGDFRNGEYNGFGIIQVDKYKAPIPGLPKILQEACGKKPLDQYAEESIEWGVQSFLTKLKEVKENNPQLSEANQIATAMSKYNGGYKNPKVVYPKNDLKTTGHDYANDALVRTRWFANNWDSLK